MSRPSRVFMNIIFIPVANLPEEEVIEKVVREFVSGAIECNSIALERKGSVVTLDRAER